MSLGTLVFLAIHLIHILAADSIFSLKITLDDESRQLATNIRQMQEEGAITDVEVHGEAEAYVVTFFSKLLYQREKMVGIPAAEILSTWDDLLTTLEHSRR